MAARQMRVKIGNTSNSQQITVATMQKEHGASPPSLTLVYKEVLDIFRTVTNCKSSLATIRLHWNLRYDPVLGSGRRFRFHSPKTGHRNKSSRLRFTRVRGDPVIPSIPFVLVSRFSVVSQWCIWLWW